MFTKLEPIGSLRTGGAVAQRGRRTGGPLGRLAGYLALLILTGLSLFPLVWMILTSLRDRTEVLGGAGEFGIFWRIMLPLARPGVATITIFQFMNTWNEFIFAATFLHDPALRPLQPAIFALVGRYSTNWPALAGGLTISILPVI